MLRTSLLLATIVFGMLSACGSGGSDESAEGGNDNGVVESESNSALAKSEAVRSVTGLLFVAGGSAADEGGDSSAGPDRGTDRTARQVSRTFSCPESGSAQLAGDLLVNLSSVPKTFSLDASAVLSNCNGNSGDAEIQIDGASQQGLVGFTTVVSASLSGTCTVEIPGVTEHAEVVATSTNSASDEQTLNVTGTLTGSASADCNGQSVRCVWNNVDISNRVALTAGCISIP